MGGSNATKSLSWTNSNAWISDISGRASFSGAVATFKVNSAAFGLDRGVKAYVDVWSW